MFDLHGFIEMHRNWWWVLPLLVFVARVMDVSLGTLRVLFLSRGMKLLAPAVGFFEVLIWITAIAQVVRNLDNVMAYIAYAGGYGLGTYVGLRIEEKLALGTLIVRIITQQPAERLVRDLRRNNFGVTCLDAHGATGPVKVIFTIIRRANLRQVLDSVRHFNPNAFYTIEDVRNISKAVQAYMAAPTEGITDARPLPADHAIADAA